MLACLFDVWGDLIIYSIYRLLFLNPDICSLERDPGPCMAYEALWYFEPITQACRRFRYGGCHGNDNRFYSLAECEDRCLYNRPDPDTTTIDTGLGGWTPEPDTTTVMIPTWMWTTTPPTTTEYHEEPTTEFVGELLHTINLCSYSNVFI